jgi:phosphonate transport system ATP-binding protein
MDTVSTQTTGTPTTNGRAAVPAARSVPGTAAAIEVAGLTMEYRGGHRALDGIDLAITPGQVVALVGANGSGKSTLLRCMVRLIQPSSGRVDIGGTDITAAGRSELRLARARVGFVFQRFHLVPRLSAFRNVLHGAVGRQGHRCLWPVSAPEDIRREGIDCLRRVGLADQANRRVDTLSGGQQQRVAIARMLMQRPQVILADEPVASLDPVAGVGVMDLLRDVAAERGLTAIVALHQLDLALTYTERIVGLRAGRIALDRETAACEGSELDALYRLVAA